MLLVAGFAVLLILIWKLMWGHVDSGRTEREVSSIEHD
jgi:hypothetical protein